MGCWRKKNTSIEERREGEGGRWELGAGVSPVPRFFSADITQKKARARSPAGGERERVRERGRGRERGRERMIERERERERAGKRRERGYETWGKKEEGEGEERRTRPQTALRIFLSCLLFLVLCKLLAHAPAQGRRTGESCRASE